MYTIKPLIAETLGQLAPLPSSDGVWMYGLYQSEPTREGVSYTQFHDIPATVGMSLITPVVASLITSVTAHTAGVEQQIYAQACGLCYAALRILHASPDLGCVVDYGNNLYLLLNLSLANNLLSGEVVLLAGSKYEDVKVAFESNVKQLEVAVIPAPQPTPTAPRHKLH